jgi:hypothetical protein
VCLLGRLGALLWWVAGEWGPMGLQVEAFQVGLWSVGLTCLKGVGQWSGDPVCLWIAGLADFRGTIPTEILQACAGMRGRQHSKDLHLWIPGLAGLRGAGLWSGYCASLCRPGPVE